MPRRIVIHAGFHKTGTSTVQQVLREQRPVLKPYLRSLLGWSMRDVLSAARGYSTWRDPLTLDKFARRFRTLLERQGDMPRRVLCLSAEELAGHLPGREALADYGAAPDLAAEMARVVAAVFPGVELVFLYTTRDPSAWLESAYWEHVKSSSMTLDFDSFRARHGAAAALDAIVDRIARAQPHPVHRARLEDCRTLAGGPAAPLLRLCDVPEPVIAGLPPPPVANARPDAATLRALLDANRRHADRDRRAAAKRAILAARQETDLD